MIPAIFDEYVCSIGDHESGLNIHIQHYTTCFMLHGEVTAPMALYRTFFVLPELSGGQTDDGCFMVV